ncbi:hypothetical protein [Mesorhizobium neociceri]|uniref:Uncharacterized protein n=1 Tax=Mesorhizobium neociceri TaxID=1307853 RepID=A0A838B7T0_9HYPH|nr:hypothetical protein [Mesorhizobium neociceri]MBA1141734.1 hypothetical protein [Mesorhizobium neociceri]
MSELPAPPIAPSLDDLRSALSRAERDLVCADMIDNGQRRQIEMGAAQRRVDDLKAQISRLEESF